MKLVLHYYWSVEHVASGTVSDPLDYESKEKAISDFETLYLTYLENQKKERYDKKYKLGNLTFDDYFFECLFKGSEISECIFTLDEWWEKYK